MYTLSQGILIAVEGIDGSGKSTLCTQLYSTFAEKIPSILTKEPGGTPLGAQLRALVQSDTPRCAKTEFLLFAADRAQHIACVIKPALQEKKMIISDRLADSSLVYQGYGRGLDRTMITQINCWAMDNIKPNLTLYIRIPLEIARTRIMQRNAQLTSFEKEKETFIQKLIDGFDTLYADRTDVITLDGTQSIEQIQDTAYQRIALWLTKKGIYSHE